MRTRYKVLLALFLFSLLLIIGLGIAAVVVLTMRSADEPVPDDSDLAANRMEIPDSDNGFTYIQRAEMRHEWPGYTPPGEDSKDARRPGEATKETPEARATREKAEQLDRMVDGQAWNQVLAASILERNRETFALLERGMACPAFQVPEVPSVDTKMPETFAFLQLGRLLGLRVEADMRAGRDEEALEGAMAMAQFGHRIEGAEGPLVNFLVGMTVKGMGAEAFARTLARTSLPPARLQPYVARLRELADYSESFPDALRAEYQMEMGSLKDLIEGKIRLSNLRRQYGMGPQDVGSHEGGQGALYKPNETKRLFRDAFRHWIEQVPKPFAEVRRLEPPWPKDQGTATQMLSGNVVGRMCYTILTPASDGALKLKCRARSRLAILQTLVALKCFKARTGRLPRTLDELVPDYLEAVPLDDFDGKPIRYSVDKKILYSVDAGLKDSGGFSREEAQAWAKENLTDYEGGHPDVYSIPNPSWPIDF
jgi:hypothetical protein